MDATETDTRKRQFDLVGFLLMSGLGLILTIVMLMMIWIKPSSQTTAVTLTVKNVVRTSVTKYYSNTGVKQVDSALNPQTEGSRFELVEFPDRVFFIPDTISDGDKIEIYLSPGEKVEDFEATVLGPMKYKLVPKKK